MTAKKPKTRTRRGRGEGGIYQRPDKRWVAQVYVDIGGGDRVKRVALADTKAEALEKLRALQIRHIGASAIPTESRTVGDLLAVWLSHKQPTLAPTTYANYESSSRCWLTPELGELPLSDLTVPRVRVLFERLATKTGAGAAGQCFDVLSRAMKHAVSIGWATSNPCASLRRPRHPRREMQVWSASQVAHFIAATRGMDGHAAAVVMLTLGLRAGEARGLMWRDLDEPAALLHIRRQSGPFGVRAPKSRSSARSVHLPRITLDTLREHRAAIAARFDELPEPMFPNADGQHLSKEALDGRWQKMVKAAGLPMRRQHEARHSAASMMLAQGVDARTVSEVLGHSGVTITLQTYAHSSPALHAAAAAKVDAAIGSTEGVAVVPVTSAPERKPPKA